jgi:hypothetical protein
MGSAISTTNLPTEEELHTGQTTDALHSQNPKYRPYHGLPVPAEASVKRDELQTWYAVFFEQAECVPHRDGKHIIIRWPHPSHGHMHDYGRDLTGWPVIKIQNVYQRIGKDHARIVR